MFFSCTILFCGHGQEQDLQIRRLRLSSIFSILYFSSQCVVNHFDVHVTLNQIFLGSENDDLMLTELTGWKKPFTRNDLFSAVCHPFNL
jgi:hypothetical protein